MSLNELVSVRNINSKNEVENFERSLLKYIQNGRLEEFVKLLDGKVDYIFKHVGRSANCLQIAALNGKHRICRFLVENGVNVGYKSSEYNNFSALHFSLLILNGDKREHMNVVSILLDALLRMAEEENMDNRVDGGWRNLKDSDGHNFLHCLTRNCNQLGSSHKSKDWVSKRDDIRESVITFFEQRNLGKIHFNTFCVICYKEPVIGPIHTASGKSNVNIHPSGSTDDTKYYCSGCFELLSPNKKKKVFFEEDEEQEEDQKEENLIPRQKKFIHETQRKLFRIIESKNIHDFQHFISSETFKVNPLLLEHVITFTHPKFRISPFEHACLVEGGEEMVKYFIYRYPNHTKSQKNHLGFTPLHFSVAKSNIRTVKVIITSLQEHHHGDQEFSSSTSIIESITHLKDREGKVALLHALEKEDVEIVKVLLPHTNLRLILDKFRHNFRMFCNFIHRRIRSLEIQKLIFTKIFFLSRKRLEAKRRKDGMAELTFMESGGNILFLVFEYIRLHDFLSLKDLFDVCYIVKENNKQEIRQFLRKSKDYVLGERTPLVYAYITSTPEIVKLLLQKGSKIAELIEYLGLPQKGDLKVSHVLSVIDQQKGMRMKNVIEDYFKEIYVRSTTTDSSSSNIRKSTTTFNPGPVVFRRRNEKEEVDKSGSSSSSNEQEAEAERRNKEYNREKRKYIEITLLILYKLGFAEYADEIVLKRGWVSVLDLPRLKEDELRMIMGSNEDVVKFLNVDWMNVFRENHISIKGFGDESKKC